MGRILSYREQYKPLYPYLEHAHDGEGGGVQESGPQEAPDRPAFP